jgi:RimJ/RimL family protein N-acetyltransferase
MSLGARPLRAADRDMLRAWRNDPRVRHVSRTQREIAAEEHQQWFDRVLNERADQLVVVTVDDAPCGVAQLEQVDAANSTASWGCHLGRFDVPPYIGASLPLIGLGLGFGRFALRRMEALVLGCNTNMLGIHRRFKVPLEGVRRHGQRLDDGSTVDVHEFGVLADEWPALRERGLSMLPGDARRGLGHLLDNLAAGTLS